MKKVKGVLVLKKGATYWEIKIFNEAHIIKQCLDQWHKTDGALSIELSFEIKSKFQFKTQSQLGYLNASIKPTIISAIQAHGDERKPDEIWDNIKAEVGFVVKKESPVDHAVYWDVKSCATSSKEEVSEFIDKLIRWAGEWGIVIETPEQYKKRNGIKDWK